VCALRSADSAASKVYGLHAPEMECVGNGKPHKPYEFGVKVSVATTLKHSRGGQFVAHAQALPGKPYDGHRLAAVIPAIEQLVGNTIERLHADAGYRGHNAPPDYKFKNLYIQAKAAGDPADKARDATAPPLNPSLSISRKTTEWAATISPTATATSITPSSPRSATTSAA
jgi:hypothetical protein